MSFMTPHVYRGRCYLVSTTHGETLLPADVVGSKTLGLRDGETATCASACERWPSMVAQVHPYIDGEVESITALGTVWYGRYSADGYMDATDYVHGDTELEVRTELREIYGDDDEPCHYCDGDGPESGDACDCCGARSPLIDDADANNDND